MKYLLGCDVGTTGTKTLLFTEDGKLLGHAYRAYPLLTPAVGMSEQYAEDWWKAVCETVREVVSNISDPENVAAIVGLGEACRIARERMKENAEKTRSLRDHLLGKLREVPKMKLNSLDTVLEMPYFNVYSAMYENRETSHIAQYDIVSRNKGLTMQNLGRNLPVSAVAILPVDPVNRRILLTREFRMPVNDYLVAIPAGLVDPGEDVRAAVIRELREETGCIADRVMVLPPAFSCIGLTDETAACAIVITSLPSMTASKAR